MSDETNDACKTLTHLNANVRTSRDWTSAIFGGIFIVACAYYLVKGQKTYAGRSDARIPAYH